MNKRDEKAETAEELLRRYHLLKLQETEYIENRFESLEVKQSIYKNYELSDFKEFRAKFLKEDWDKDGLL